MKAIDFSKYDLKIQEQRDAAINHLSKWAERDFKANSHIHESSFVQVYDWYIFIQIEDPNKADKEAFGCSVELTAQTSLTKESPIKRVQTDIGISTSGLGGFNPEKRPLTAAKFHNMASLIANWTKTVEVFNFYTSEYRRLKSLVEQQNNIK